METNYKIVCLITLAVTSCGSSKYRDTVGLDQIKMLVGFQDGTIKCRINDRSHSCIFKSKNILNLNSTYIKENGLTVGEADISAYEAGHSSYCGRVFDDDRVKSVTIYDTNNNSVGIDMFLSDFALCVKANTLPGDKVF